MRLEILAMAAAVAGPPAPSGVGYGPVAEATGPVDRCAGTAGEIVVCADRTRPSPRLPLPDERAPRVAPSNAREESAAAFEARLGCRMGCNPIESAEKGRRLVKILTGQDPDD